VKIATPDTKEEIQPKFHAQRYDKLKHKIHRISFAVFDASF
jgi:hypothetical protein